jgi:hypothetical protein
MDNPDKLATLGTQDEERQNKKYNTICVEHSNYSHEISALVIYILIFRRIYIYIYIYV